LSLLVSIWTSSLRSYGGRMPLARAICGPMSCMLPETLEESEGAGNRGSWFHR